MKLFKIPLHFNIIYGMVSVLVIYLLYKNVEGYKFLKDVIIEKNKERAEYFKDATLDQYAMYKLGWDYEAVLRIKRKVDANSVILMPSQREVIELRNKRKNKLRLSKGDGIHSNIWLSYYLYPTEVIYDSTDYFYKNKDRITSVVCIDGVGYDNVNYEVSKKKVFDVLPINN